MTKQWFLESATARDIARSKAHFEALVEFHWRYYYELEIQRSKIRDQLHASLRESAGAFEFQNWQRAVKYKYSLDPLGTKGSLVDPGGRFNIGEIDPARYRVFAALYLAKTKGTALAEVLGRESNTGELTPEELALTKSDSITVVSVTGKLDFVLDVRNRNNLSAFVNLVKDFKLPKALIVRARILGFTLRLIRTVSELGKVLEQRPWREWPALYDVPAVSQIFGGIAMDAGVEGILYNSVITGDPCLVLFPQTFLNSSSWVQLDDPAPKPEVPRRIDSSNFSAFV